MISQHLCKWCYIEINSQKYGLSKPVLAYQYLGYKTV